MELENQGIKCNNFWDTQAVIKKIEVKVREAWSIKERKYYAQDIVLEAETLLSCLNYNPRNPECLSCHSISRRLIQEYEPRTFLLHSDSSQ